MNKIIVCLILIACIFSLGMDFIPGEEFSYEVRYKGIKIGKSVLTFHGEDSIEGKYVYHITFSTRVNAFTDVEDLYADKENFLPIEVRRRLKRFGTFATNITERYDQEKFRVDIEKKSRFFKDEFFIEGNAPINNAILLTYYCRTIDDFNTIKDFKVILPNAKFKIIFQGTETIETPLGEFEAYTFTSSPSKFKFWLSADEKRIPLKIENPSGLDYSLGIVSMD